MNEDLLTAIVGVVAAVLGAFAQQLVTAARDRMERTGSPSRCRQTTPCCGSGTANWWTPSTAARRHRRRNHQTDCSTMINHQ